MRSPSRGIPALSPPAATITADYVIKVDLQGADIVCLSYFTSCPAISARHVCQRPAAALARFAHRPGAVECSAGGWENEALEALRRRGRDLDGRGGSSHSAHR